MLHVAVVEDETEYRGLIQEMVGRYAKEYDRGHPGEYREHHPDYYQSRGS